MNDVKVSRTVVVNIPQGIHARPANLIVRRMQSFQAKVEFVRENQRVDGKSILELLTLAAEQGTQLQVEATGPEAQQAVDAIVELFASNFAEQEESQNKLNN
jgi:phosphotransferase system HPr (HPr) family protein